MALKAALAVAGAVVSAVGSIAQGNAQNAMAKYNAQLAERDAEAARRRASLEEDIHRDRAGRLLSRQRALYAASGVDTGTGSPLSVAEQTAEDAELDALAIRYGGAVGALRYRGEAGQHRMAGRAAKRRGLFEAAGTLLTAGGDTAFDFGGGKKVPSYTSGIRGGHGRMVGGV